MNNQIIEKAKKIKLLVLDVDGVLTDGRIIYDNFGGELKAFHALDGAGLKFWKRAKGKSAIITGRKSRIVKRRAAELGIDKVYQGALDKLKVFKKLPRMFSVNLDEICYIGDDMPDLPCASRSGLACATSNAQEDYKTSCDYVTKCGGGEGAVREVIELILKAQDKYQEVTEKYRK